MKKLLILILSTFLLTGCYDYQELNNRAIISGVALDLEDNKFQVTLEILTIKKSESDSGSSDKTYYVEGSGNTLSEAFKDCNLKINKEPYYAHLKVLIISQEIAKEKMSEVIDYMLREPNIRNIFIPVLSENTKAKVLLQSTTDESPIVSEAIENMLETNKAIESIAFDYDFETFVSSFVDKKKDAYLNSIRKEENNFKLSGIGAFENHKLKTILNEQQSSILNIISNASNKHLISVPCNNKNYTNINMHYNLGTFTEVTDKITIKSYISGTIVEDTCQLDFRNPDTYKDLQTKSNKVIQKEYENLLNTLKKNKTDLLGIQENYYKKERKDLTNWYQLDVEFDIQVTLNKNGLIFKVDDYE